MPYFGNNGDCRQRTAKAPVRALQALNCHPEKAAGRVYLSGKELVHEHIIDAAVLRMAADAGGPFL